MKLTIFLWVNLSSVCLWWSTCSIFGSLNWVVFLLLSFECSLYTLIYILCQISDLQIFYYGLCLIFSFSQQNLPQSKNSSMIKTKGITTVTCLDQRMHESHWRRKEESMALLSQLTSKPSTLHHWNTVAYREDDSTKQGLELIQFLVIIFQLGD